MADDASKNNGDDDRRQRLAKVRRRLNFDDDPTSPPVRQMDEAKAVLNYIRNQSKDAAARWNFDFANETPLEGVWEWEKVENRTQQDYKELTIERENKNGKENRTI